MTAKLQRQDPQSTPLYDTDIIAWANEQARLLRTGCLDQLDIEHIAEEIEDVGKSEQRELANRMAVLLADLIQWQCQPERQGNSWRRTIRDRRNSIARRLRATPSLKRCLSDPDWCADAWGDAVAAATAEAGLDDLPQDCPWAVGQVLDPDWLPESPALKLG
jgi:hypothetical protein